MCNNMGRLLCGVSCVCCDRFSLVDLVREENEEAAGPEPCCMEMQT